MKNNKGFSLVELIIVIAIMAILVGVMAPQLIKYIEKSKVSADTQLADTVHSALLTAMMDPEVVNNTNY
ncbi:MAG: prepilin-type N-terminal cleavage/methylation domain-containing protein, partial [Lachnospiraceae bacterium]|nr:prepilin-type N-terminal cleavage/methylation domain-containing protein [Lachnospiraceae bacterium]